MDEVLIREKIKDLILDNGLLAFIQIPARSRDELLALCVSYSELDWLFEKRVIDKIVRFVISDDTDDAVDLGREIKSTLADYFSMPLEEMFDDVLSDIEQSRREAANLRRYVDPINGEVSWSR